MIQKSSKNICAKLVLYIQVQYILKFTIVRILIQIKKNTTNSSSLIIKIHKYKYIAPYIPVHKHYLLII